MTDVWNPVTHKQLHGNKLNRAQEDRRWCAEEETVKGHRRTWKDMDNSNKAAQRQLWSAMHARTEEKWEGSCRREDDVGKDETRRRVICQAVKVMLIPEVRRRAMKRER